MFEEVGLTGSDVTLFAVETDTIDDIVPELNVDSFTDSRVLAYFESFQSVTGSPASIFASHSSDFQE